MFSMFIWRCYYKWWKSLSPTLEMIENMSFGLDIGLGFRHVWTRPTYPINNNIYYFIIESVSLCTAVIIETKCLFSNVYFSLSLIHEKELFQRKLSLWDFLFIHFVSKREKEALSSSQSTTLCASFSCWRSFYFGRQTPTSLKASQWLCEGRNLL